ncbi:MAG: HprK-related kinase B [Longimicrobiales bacterium]
MSRVTVAGLRARALEAADLLPPLRLDVDGCRVEVATNDPDLEKALGRYFRERRTESTGEPVFRIVAIEGPEVDVSLDLTVKPPEPGKAKVKEEWADVVDGRVVRKLTTGMLFAFGGHTHLAWGPCRANDNQVVNFVNNRYMQWRIEQGYVLAHAGAVAREGRGLAMCGASGSGKSTTALGLVARGLDFVSNDRALLRPGPDGVELLGIPKHPRVNPGTLVHNPLLHPILTAEQRDAYRAMDPDHLLRLEDKYDVLIDEIVGPDRFPLRARLQALVVVAWSGVGKARIRPVDLSARDDLLAHVMKSPGLFYEPSDEADVRLDAGRYVDVVARVPVYEITGTRNFAAAEELCAAVLDGPSRN